MDLSGDRDFNPCVPIFPVMIPGRLLTVSNIGTLQERGPEARQVWVEAHRDWLVVLRIPHSGCILGLYRDDGKNGNYASILGLYIGVTQG